MSESETASKAGTVSEGPFDLDVRQRLYVFAAVDVLVILAVLAIAFL